MADISLRSVEVTNGNTKSNSLFLSFASNVLPDGNRRVDTTAYPEKSVTFPSSLPHLSKQANKQFLNKVLTVLPDPLGATRITSISAGTSTFVKSLNTGENPWEKYKVFPFVNCGLMAGQVSDWAASERRFIIIVPLLMASSSPKRFFPGTHPSLTASFHEAPFSRTPMM